MTVQGRGNEPLDVVIDAAQFRAVMLAVKQFGPALQKTLRARLRTAGAPIVQSIRGVVLQDTPAGTPVASGKGHRAAIAAGTKVSLLTGAKKSGIRITTSAPKAGVMVKAYNKQTWRHPAIGQSGQWVSESGRPYFGSVISKQSAEMKAAANAALLDAIATIKNGGTSG